MIRRLWQYKLEWLKAARVGWFLAYRQIKRANIWTTILIVFVMILTFLNLVVVSGLLVGLITGSFSAYREGYSGDVLITSAVGRDYIENSPALLDFLEHHPAVREISPRHGLNVQILGTLNNLPGKNERPNQIGLRLTGFNPERENLVTNLADSLLVGEMLVPGDSNYILIGANMIRKYSSFADANIPGLDFLREVDVGSRVRVSFSSPDGNLIARDYWVKGIVKSKVDETSTRAFALDAEVRRLKPVNKNQYQEIAVLVQPGSDERLVAELKNFMGPHVARIQTSEESIPSFLRDIESTMNVLGNSLSSIALVVASITIFIVIFINAVTKRKFIGIMKGIGISPRAIQFSYFFQSLFYGLAGSAIGLILTFGLLKPYFAENPINFPFSDGILVATPAGALLRVGILIVVTLVAGYVPARLIIRKNTLDSILGR